jgi:hypothetical protein
LIVRLPVPAMRASPAAPACVAVATLSRRRPEAGALPNHNSGNALNTGCSDWSNPVSHMVILKVVGRLIHCLHQACWDLNFLELTRMEVGVESQLINRKNT